jgi:O-antigen ligase
MQEARPEKLKPGQPRPVRPRLLRQRLRQVLQGGLWLAVIFTALAHGVVEPWSLLLFEILVVALLFIWAGLVCQERHLDVFLPPIIWPLGLFLLLGAAQSVAWVDAAGVRRSLSLDVEATRSTVLVLSCLCLCVVLASQVWQHRGAWHALARGLPLYGLVLALLAILQHFTARNSILWLREVSPASPFGTFINRDHFAGYLELLIGFPVALIATQYVRGEGRFVYLVAALLMGLAVLLTLSRGGTVSLLVELLFIAALARKRATNLQGERQTTPHARRGRLEGLGVATVGVVLAGIIGGTLWIGAEPLVTRFVMGSGDAANPQPLEDSRKLIWRDTWRLIRARPWVGAGLGAYETAFPIYALDENERGGIVAQAHNDYLQVLADTGVSGAILLVWFLVLVLRAMLASTRVRDPLSSGLALGCSGGLLGLLVHSFFDFNLQLVSHALLFLLLCVVLQVIEHQPPTTFADFSLGHSGSETPSEESREQGERVSVA